MSCQWKISCLKVDNWKSFKNPTEIPFFDGLNCLMGENGAGKSNVLDAISFAFGESPSNLRVKSLKELAGVPNRKVEVELILVHALVSNSKQNSDKPTRIGSSIVDGIRYFLVNGCRFPKHRFDETVAELGLHIGGQAVWRINQSEVNRNVSLKPSELYDCISQVSGTKLFNQRRADALRQTGLCKKALATVVTNLNRLKAEVASDKTIMEDDEHIEELVLELGETIPGKRNCLEYHQLKAEEEIHALKEDSCRRKLADVIQNKLDSKRQLQELEKVEKEDEDNSNKEDSHQLKTDFKVACTKADECQSELEDTVEILGAMTSFNDSLPRLSNSLQSIRTIELPAMESKQKLLNSTARSAECQLRAAQRLSLDKRASMNSEESMTVLLNRTIDDVTCEIKHNDLNIEKQLNLIAELGKQVQICKVESNKYKKEICLDTTALHDMESSISSTWKNHFETYHNISCVDPASALSLEQETKFLEGQLKVFDQQKMKLNNACSSLAFRLRCWLPEKPLPGFYLYEKVTCDTQHESDCLVALNCILSGSLCVRVVATTKEALCFSKAASAANQSSRVWPNDRIDQPSGSLMRSRKSNVEKLIANIQSHNISCQDPLSLLHYDREDALVSAAAVKAVTNWVIAEDDETAKAILKLSGGKLRVVTLCGNQHTLGRLVGGSNNSKSTKSHSKLHIANQLSQSLLQLSELEISLSQTIQGIDALRVVSDNIDETCEIREKLKYAESKTATSIAEIDELTLQLTLAQSQLEQSNELNGVALKKLAKARRDIEKLTSNGGSCEHEDVLSHLEAAHHEALAAVDSVDISIAKLLERQEMLIESLKTDNVEVEERLLKVNPNIDFKDPQMIISACATCIKTLDADRARCIANLESLNHDKDKLRDLLVEFKNSDDEKRSKVYKLMSEKQRLQLLISEAHTFEQSLGAQIQAHVRASSIVAKKISGLQSFAEKYGSLITLTEDSSYQEDNPNEFSELISEKLYALKAEENSKREELKLLRQKVNKKGRQRIQPTNHATLKAKLKAIDTLEQQMKSVDEAIQHLEVGIQEAVELMKDANLACFESVSVSFSRQVKMLIPGRVGVMEVTGTTLEDGISISFATIGDDSIERSRGMSELSGGQKALVGLALTFSLSLFRQLPIYILDEIDAPLDEHNQAEAAKAVTELFYGSQIICISHHSPFHKRADHIVQIARENESSKLVRVFHQSK